MAQQVALTPRIEQILRDPDVCGTCKSHEVQRALVWDQLDQGWKPKGPNFPHEPSPVSRTAGGAYLFYNRPDTATNARNKKKHLRQALESQIAEKAGARDRELFSEIGNAGQHRKAHLESYLGDQTQRTGERLQKKLAYKQALEEQMAQQAIRNGRPEEEFWWMKRQAHVASYPVADDPMRRDQLLDRQLRQQKAAEQLESFVDQDRSARAENEQQQLQRRRQLAPEINVSDASVASRHRSPESMERAHEAWRAAHEAEEARVHGLQSGRGVSIVDQFVNKHRCKICHKIIEEEHVSHEVQHQRDGGEQQAEEQPEPSAAEEVEPTKEVDNPE